MKKFFTVFLTTIALTVSGVAQQGENSFSVKEIQEAEVPQGVSRKGSFAFAFTWNDKLGVNTVVVCTTGVKDSPKKVRGEAVQDIDMYAYHLVQSRPGAKAKLLWQITDGVHQCQFDELLDVPKNAFRLSDLNKNGIAESWLYYTLTCTSDVSPKGAKLIMHEKAAKYAVRGTETMITVAGGTRERFVDKGTMKMSMPKNKAFQKYAKALWEELAVYQLNTP